MYIYIKLKIKETVHITLQYARSITMYIKANTDPLREFLCKNVKLSLNSFNFFKLTDTVLDDAFSMVLENKYDILYSRYIHLIDAL